VFSVLSFWFESWGVTAAADASAQSPESSARAASPDPAFGAAGAADACFQVFTFGVGV
jgi:hypothetical protein